MANSPRFLLGILCFAAIWWQNEAAQVVLPHFHAFFAMKSSLFWCFLSHEYAQSFLFAHFTPTFTPMRALFPLAASRHQVLFDVPCAKRPVPASA